MKRTIAIMAVLLAAFWLYGTPAMAQGRPAGVGGGAGAAAGHPMGNPTGMGGGYGAAGHAGGHGPADLPTASSGSHAASSSPDSVLSHNSNLNTNLTSALQKSGALASGQTLQSACSGFKNLGQCVAALHVSKNLGFSFDCLKANMTGTAPPTGSTCPAGTGSKSLNLGKSIQALDPNVNAKGAAKTGTHQANSDINDSDKS